MYEILVEPGGFNGLISFYFLSFHILLINFLRTFSFDFFNLWKMRTIINLSKKHY